MRLADYLCGTRFTRSEHHQGGHIGRYVLAQADYGNLLRQRSAVAHVAGQHAAVSEDAGIVFSMIPDRFRDDPLRLGERARVSIDISGHADEYGSAHPH